MSKRVLVAPLDWGLGHATRCVPIIRELLKRGCNVFISGAGQSLKLLEQEFPGLQSFQLASYDPKYPKSGTGMARKMAAQLPHFFSTVKMEHRQVARIIREQKIDLVISDNRYGCYSQSVPSVFITHQSNILMPKRFGWLGPVVNRVAHVYMKRFTQCWIPDAPGDENLSGALNDERQLRKLKHVFVGVLSRFSHCRKQAYEYEVLAIFSGPEPQRSIFENIVTTQLSSSGLKYAVVRGVIENDQEVEPGSTYNYLTTQRLQELICASEIVVCRSGYSSVMDLAALRKRAILVPTPGQTEQEYLADLMMKKGFAFSVPQEVFDFKTALHTSNDYRGFESLSEPYLLAKAIDEILSQA